MIEEKDPRLSDLNAAHEEKDPRLADLDESQHLVIEEKDPRLSDLRSSGKHLANWEAHVASPTRTSWLHKQQHEAPREEVPREDAHLERDTPPASPPPGFLR